MAAGLVFHNITTSTGVTFAIAQWVPDTASPDANAKAVMSLFETGGAEINPARSQWQAGKGVGLSWTDAITGANLSSLVSGNALLSDVAIVNGTALDKYMDISINLAAITTPNTDGLNISIHLYPLNADGTSYGDGRFGSSAAGPCLYPPVATIPLVKNLTTTAQTGSATGIVLPPGTFKLVIVNNAGVNLASSGNTLKYRTYN